MQGPNVTPTTCLPFELGTATSSMGAVGALDARAGNWVLQTLELGTATSSMGIIRGRGAVGLITSWETERCGRAGHGVVEERLQKGRVKRLITALFSAEGAA